jgi:hypothetical protein
MAQRAVVRALETALAGTVTNTGHNDNPKDVP